jgi:hypothetical protein
MLRLNRLDVELLHLQIAPGLRYLNNCSNKSEASHGPK